MNAACPVRIAEITNDCHLERTHRTAAVNAAEQLRRVEKMARHLLGGAKFIDVRKTYRGAAVVGETTRMFSFRHIGDLVAEDLTDSLLQSIYKGEEKGVFQLQKLIGDCANKIAFDALNLWDDYTDFDDLKSVAEDCQ